MVWPDRGMMRTAIVLFCSSALSLGFVACARPGSSSGVHASGSAPLSAPADADTRDHTESAPVACPAVLPQGMSCVPGGEFLVGSNQKDWARENPELSAFAEHRVTLSTFLIDQFEVTTEQYQACVKSGSCTAARSNYPHMRGARQPQLKANWFQAAAYCSAAGKRLPTEAEFEAASRGPTGEVYPWGNEVANCQLAIIADRTGRGCAGHSGEGKLPTPARFAKTGNTWNVGSRPAGRYGLFDMAGNAQEWVSDWFSPTLKACGEACAGRNPRGPCAGAMRCPGFTRKLVKGGAWYWGPISARAAARRPYGPKNSPPHHFGFRCAKTVR